MQLKEHNAGPSMFLWPGEPQKKKSSWGTGEDLAHQSGPEDTDELFQKHSVIWVGFFTLLKDRKPAGDSLIPTYLKCNRAPSDTAMNTR